MLSQFSGGMYVMLLGRTGVVHPFSVRFSESNTAECAKQMRVERQASACSEFQLRLHDCNGQSAETCRSVETLHREKNNTECNTTK